MGFPIRDVSIPECFGFLALFGGLHLGNDGTVRKKTSGSRDLRQCHIRLGSDHVLFKHTFQLFGTLHDLGAMNALPSHRKESVGRSRYIHLKMGLAIVDVVPFLVVGEIIYQEKDVDACPGGAEFRIGIQFIHDFLRPLVQLAIMDTAVQISHADFAKTSDAHTIEATAVVRSQSLFKGTEVRGLAWVGSCSILLIWHFVWLHRICCFQLQSVQAEQPTLLNAGRDTSVIESCLCGHIHFFHSLANHPSGCLLSEGLLPFSVTLGKRTTPLFLEGR